MSASSKYDMSSNSPDGSSYPNGSRGPYATASLEKSGSFREGMENRLTSSLAGIPRPGSASSQGDPSSLVHSLLSDLKPMVLDQKFPRPGELKRSISNILGIASEDCIPSTYSMRALPSSSLDEIKRLRSNISECSLKARDRAKVFGEATSKIDKYSHNMPRKRSRVDNSSGERPNILLPGGSTPRPGPQSHSSASGLEGGPPKLEERVKSGVPSRRVRTSRVDGRVDARTNGIARPPGPVERDKEVSKFVNIGATLLEEKGRALPSGVDGWEKSKMKKKRSVIKPDASANAALARPLESDRESKRGIQQKLISDARPRLSNAHGFRSGPVTAATGVAKTDSTCQQNGLGVRPFSRNEQDTSSLPNDRRDRTAGSDKDGATLKAANKLSREDNYAASPTSTTQVNASARGPRSNSGSMFKASPNVHRVMGSSDEWEHPPGANKLNSTAGAVNRKRSTPSSPSPPVAQWGGQRPQKITRVARRSNLTPIVSGHDEISASDMVDNAVINDGGVFARRSSSNTAQQSKLKGEHISNSVLLDNEESGASDSKSKDRGKKCRDIEERSGQAVQKVSTLVLPSRKNKMAVDEDLGDGVRRQGRIGRGFAPTGSGVPVATEKLDNAQWRNGKIGSEKIESKPGRPPAKKWSERKGHMRPVHSLNNDPTEFAGELDDDSEELLSAAIAAMNPSTISAANATDTTKFAAMDNTKSAAKKKDPSFWEQIEPVFRFLSAEDVAFLKQQGDHGFLSLPSTPALASRGDCNAVSNGIVLDERDRNSGLANQTEPVEALLEQLVRGDGAPSGVSICQALLSAIVDEEEIETYHSDNNKGEENLFDDAYGIHFEFGEELKLKGSTFCSLGTFHAPERAPYNGYRIDPGPGYFADMACEKLGSNCALSEPSVEGHARDELLPNGAMACISTCTEFQYNQMCINDRILLELSELGLYPEPVPDLAQSEDEEIGKGISILEEKLNEQVTKKKSLLPKLEKAVMEATKNQLRVLERIALDKLMGVAYKKYMDCWGPNATGSKSGNKAMKHAALAFVRRTLTRCQKFEETGISCFSEPFFRDMFLSLSSRCNGAEGIAGDGEATNAPTSITETFSTDHNSRLASQPSQRVDIHGNHSDTFLSVNYLPEQMFGREDPWTNKVRKRELLLDDVVGTSAASSLRAPSSLGNSLVSGTKGKRSEREGKGQNRDAASRNGTAKIGRPSLSNAKGERKNKAKPKQRTAQLSASVNSLLSKPAEGSNLSPSAPKSRETLVGGNTKKDDSGLLPDQKTTRDIHNDSEAIDLSNLQLPELDGDFGGHGQDIASWLNIDDEDGYQDHDDFMGGLEIPMDDLSEVNMMI